MCILPTQIPDGHCGQGSLAVPTTRPACLPVECATVSILHFAWGKVWGHQALKFMVSQPLLLHQLEMSPSHSRAPGGGAPVAGDTLISLHLHLPLTAQNHCALCPQFARSARASGRLCPSWHLFLGSPHLTRVPSPLQMLPGASVR